MFACHQCRFHVLDAGPLRSYLGCIKLRGPYMKHHSIRTPVAVPVKREVGPKSQEYETSPPIGLNISRKPEY
jgi:hypothetical protein